MDVNHNQQQRVDRLKRLQTFKEMVEINYFAFDLTKGMLHIDFSQKFRERANLPYDRLTVTVETFISYVDKNHQKQTREFFRNIRRLEDKAEIQSEAHLIQFPRSKGYVWMYAIVQRVSPNKAYGAHLDISELKETEIALSTAKEEYEMILMNTTDLIAKYLLTGEIVFASQSYADLYNMPVEQLRGHQVFNLEHINQEGTSDFSWFTKALKPPYQSTNVYRFVTDDKERWISFYNQAIIENGEISSVISIGHDITAIKKLNDQLIFESNHDSLTGLYNRRGIRHLLEQVDSNANYTFYLISLNNLQEINDFYGYEIGDQLIQVVGNVLRRYESLGHIVGRMSTSKFVVITNFEERRIDQYFKSQLIRELNRSFYVKDHSVYVNASVGYARYPDDSRDFHKILSFAELAAYEAQFVSSKTKRYHRTMFQQLHQNVQLASDLRESINREGIQLVYQPIIDAINFNIRYIETLARWNHPVYGLIPPNQFIAIAEKSSLMEELDFYVIEHSIQEFRMLREKFPKSILTINITPHTLRLPRLAERITKIAKQSGVNPSSICIEISENAFFANRQEVMKQIHHLKQSGLKVALDDFGSKYSSLGILDDIEVDIIKVDKSFMAKLDHQTTLILFQMIKSLADLRKKEVVIEGVEKGEQVKRLQEIGFHLIQGYFFSRPEPATRTSWINEEAMAYHEEYNVYKKPH